MALQFLQDLGLEIRPPEYTQYVEQAGQRATAAPLAVVAQMLGGLSEQEFQAQKGSYALVQGLFVDNCRGHRAQ